MQLRFQIMRSCACLCVCLSSVRVCMCVTNTSTQAGQGGAPKFEHSRNSWCVCTVGTLTWGRRQTFSMPGIMPGIVPKALMQLTFLTCVTLPITRNVPLPVTRHYVYACDHNMCVHAHMVYECTNCTSINSRLLPCFPPSVY